MRYLFYLLSFVLLTSCVHQKIRFVKANERQKVVDNTERERTNFNVKNAEVYQQPFTQESSKTADIQEVTFEEDAPEEVVLGAKAHDKNIAPSPQDSVLITENEYKYLVAERAEKDARNAKRWFSVSLALMIFPITGIFALIPFIVGLVMLKNSNRSLYITPEGQRQARIANILKWIISALWILAVIAVGIAIAILIL